MKIEAVAIVIVGGVLAGVQLAAVTARPAPEPAASLVNRVASRPGTVSPAASASTLPAPSSVAAAAPHLLFPVAGVGAAALVGRFGDPRDGGSRAHAGLDILAPRGTPVLAPAAGTIVATGERPRGGKVVWLDVAGRGLRLFFAHLDAYEVAAGDRVEAGQEIGRVGNTGNAAATSPHLHFEVRRDGRAVDPASMLESP